jgi:hypothetical protein
MCICTLGMVCAASLGFYYGQRSAKRRKSPTPVVLAWPAHSNHQWCSSDGVHWFEARTEGVYGAGCYAADDAWRSVDIPEEERP